MGLHLQFLFIVGYQLLFAWGNQTPPHIIFILADDLGWNDVSFHGSQQIPTPNIDNLAYGGIILNNYYVSPICSPSRSALMTGKHPINTGMQHDVIYGSQPYGLPLSEKLLPEYLKELGYSTHIVGKWHLGFFDPLYTPLCRGFDSHYGYFCGHQDYYDHTAQESASYWGFDMRRNSKLDKEAHGQYSSDLFTNEATKVIQNHDPSKPLFLYLAHLAVHSGNPYSPLQAPLSYTNRFPHIKNMKRRTFAGMMAGLDDSVGDVIQALGRKGMLENSIVVFSTDNGGPANGFNQNAASNWPLKGTKDTLWEGGTRGSAFIWSPLLMKRERVSMQMMHISDWLPTLYHVAGGKSSNLAPALEGINMWDALSLNLSSQRREILHNIDDILSIAALRVGDYKIVMGRTYNGQYDGWFPPYQIDESEDGEIDLSQFTSKISDVLMPFQNQESNYERWISDRRRVVASASVSCEPVPPNATLNCQPQKAPCLFNIRNDPCEFHNLASTQPTILGSLLRRLDDYNSTAVPPGNKPDDPVASPHLNGYSWLPWRNTEQRCPQ